MDLIYLTIPLAPLLGSILAGLFRNQLGRAGSHWVTILGVAVSTVLSLYVLNGFLTGSLEVYNRTVYTWMVAGGLHFEVGFLVDQLTALMMAVVSFVSLMVHIYTIGYMADDPGYQRFFSYIALFTFSMLMLVMSNNFLQLFFGWEAVGLVSYLLIGFWFKRDSAIFANLKAFLVNRVGDLGFLLGIAAIVAWCGSLDYETVFRQIPDIAGQTVQIIPGVNWSVVTLIAILLFIGAMGKSAQAPLHVWLPDSMEGPTPISALIHAATMVTAGIFMVARMSPIFEFSETALSVILVIGGITALSMGLIGVVQNDIKRVIAYSTLSQLGYMAVALGASAYGAAIFHLMTHAFFKALLFLAAGSVIIGLHHEQDMSRMGGLRRYMPVTFITAWVGGLALTGTPGFSGFFSKDAIIESVALAHRAGAGFAYWCVLIGVFVTALYTFRLLYLTFHGAERMDEHAREHCKESPAVVTVPLVLLAIPSLVIGWFTTKPLLFGDWFGGSIFVLRQHDVLAEIGHEFHGSANFVLEGFSGVPFWLAVGGFIVATVIYLLRPGSSKKIRASLGPVPWILEKKYGFDEFYQAFFARGAALLGRVFWKVGDVFAIDGLLVNGSAAVVNRFSAIARQLQSGYLYHYAFAMIVGLIVMLGAFVLF